MTKISDFTNPLPLLDELKNRTSECLSLEDVANTTLDILFQQFRESLVLTRIFAAVPYAQLPDENREFVDRLASTRDVHSLISDTTPILSLIATRGVKPAWNDRRQSAGHIGIPLVSAEFVGSIPMIARLLPEVGLELNWLDKQETGIEIHTLARLSGIFYVRDAERAVDSAGRKVISEQNFVTANGIKTVFGAGGGFAVAKTFLVLLFFCNETIEKRTAEQFLPLISRLKALSANKIIQHGLFSSS